MITTMTFIMTMISSLRMSMFCMMRIGSALADDFANSDLPFKVDVVDWAATSESFRQIIEQDKVVVQQAIQGDLKGPGDGG
jgi:hypothetical protein